MSGDVFGESDDASDEAFVEKILSINYRDVCVNIDTFKLFKVMDDEEEMRKWIECYYQVGVHPPVLKGRNLESIGVKHYQFPEISEIVRQNSCVVRLLGGQVYRGVLDYDGPKVVTVKVWSFEDFHVTRAKRFVPARLYNDIYLLKKKLNTEAYLPKLIGYSIDKGFAVVYDFAAEKCLAAALCDDNFSFEDRVCAALGVARALQLFHDQNMKFGPINPMVVILDKGMNVYLCDFGLCDDVKDKIDDHAVKDGLFDCVISNHGCTEIGTKEIWQMETDIYSYGVFLLEIISKVEIKAHSYNFLPIWAEEKIESGHSLFHESFNGIDEATKHQISELLMNCTNLDMVKRPKIASVIDSLERLKNIVDNSGSRLSKKPKL